MIIPKLSLRTVLNHKSCLLELLPHPLRLHVSPCFFHSCPLLLLREIAPSHHCNRKANTASMLLSFPHFVSRAASPSTPSTTPPRRPFFILPPPSHFSGERPPHHHLPLHSRAVFAGAEQMRSCAVCLQINRPRSPLSRAAEAASFLYLAAQYEQREGSRDGGDPGVLAWLSNALLRSSSQPSVAGRRRLKSSY